MSITSTTDRRVSTQSSVSLPSELAMRESASDDPKHVEPSAATFLRGNADDDGGAQLGIPVTPYSASQPQLTSGAEVRLGAIARWADPRAICTGTGLNRRASFAPGLRSPACCVCRPQPELYGRTFTVWQGKSAVGRWVALVEPLCR